MKVAILVDDMVDTGRTLALAAKTLQDAGAAKVYAIISHGLLSGKSVDLIKKLCLEKLVVSFRNVSRSHFALSQLDLVTHSSPSFLHDSSHSHF